LKSNFYFKKVTPLQEITTFLTKTFGKKKPPYGFLAPISILTKVLFWTSQFGLDYFDFAFLVGLFS
jgi:hypothetical protein